MEKQGRMVSRTTTDFALFRRGFYDLRSQYDVADGEEN